ncbi:MAG: LamB/YcsF family protein [Patulibacter sp.]
MPSTPTIDLNADLGEQAGDDAALLAIVTSANIACGAHAGNAQVAAQTAALARARGVAIGAHPGHPDRRHFGRRPHPIDPDRLTRLLAGQLAVLRDAGVPVRYLKLHGALYHQVADTPPLAAATVAIAAQAQLAILGPPGSVLLSQAQAAGVAAIAEGFVDRAYRLVGGRPQLVPRGAAGALLGHDAAVAQAVQLATTGSVATPGGQRLVIGAASLCLHGDTPGAVALARDVRAALEAAGVKLQAFAR